MAKAENAISTNASKGCGCSSATATAVPVGEAPKAACCGGSSAKATTVSAIAAPKAGCCSGSSDHSNHDHGDHQVAGKGTVSDPVCGMAVDPAKSQHRLEYRGDAYHFCSAGCQAKFAADPERYLDSGKSKATVPEGTIYTCPMHPQIRQNGPGNCPICGMTLEPEVLPSMRRPTPNLPT